MRKRELDVFSLGKRKQKWKDSYKKIVAWKKDSNQTIQVTRKVILTIRGNS